MRITNKTLNNNVVNGIQNSMESMARYQQMVSSGKQIDKLSDDPIKAVRILSFRSELRDIDQYQANIEDGTLWLNMNESLMSTARGLVTSARTEAQRAGNGTVDATTRESIANTIAGIREQLLAVANTRYQNRYVFGGTNSSVKPYADDGAYQGNAAAVSRKIGPGGLTVQVNYTGPEVFQSDQDVFAALSNLETALNNGDTAGINAQIDKLADVQDQMLTARSDNGSRINVSQMAAAQLEDSKAYMEDYLSSQEDADYVESVTKLKNAETVYEASLAASSVLSKTSLLDYIK